MPTVYLKGDRGYLELLKNPAVDAILIASPLAWWAMNTWLQDFAYRIDISAWVFIAAGALALLVALVSVSILAIKTATANPVKSLRSE